MNSPSGQIELQAFCRENADLVLSWRNASRVRSNSLDDKYISKHEHLEFIDRLQSKSRVHYFVVLINKEPVAVINIDASENIATWGCYIGAPDIPKPGIFPLLTLIACHFAFNICGAHAIRSDVIQKNDAPQKLNRYLGIEIVDSKVIRRTSNVAVNVLEYHLSRDDFALVKRKAMGLLTKNLRMMFSDFETTAGRHGYA